MKTALELVAEERQRQVNSEGWTIAHDDTHNNDELAKASAMYILPSNARELKIALPGRIGSDPTITMKSLNYTVWPWDAKWWKPTPENRIRELVKGATLAIAEIERLQRLQASNNNNHEPNNKQV